MYWYSKNLIFSALLLTVVFRVHADSIQFVKESIKVTILSPVSIQVTGEYFFSTKDNSQATLDMLYPFPVDSISLFPDSIIVKKIKGKESVSFIRNDRGIVFSVSVNTGDTTGILVEYVQHVKKQRGTYILTTTQSWGSPLQNSSYSVYIPTTCTLDYLSYECDSVYVQGKLTIYQFYKKQFMPDRDLVFTWSNR